MKIGCIALDLDDTLVYLQDHLEGFYRICADSGLARSQISPIVQQLIYGEGFNFEGFLAKTEFGWPSPESQNICRKLYIWMARSLKPFPDSAPTINAWLADLPVAIVTNGEQQFQKLKLDWTGLPYTKLFVLRPNGPGKGAQIRRLVNHYGPTVFVDDLPANLDNVRQAGLTADQVMTIQIRRPGCARYEESPDHLQAKSLLDVKELISN